MDTKKYYQLVRWLLAIFIAGLLLSGITAFPLLFEVNILVKLLGSGSFLGKIWPEMAFWLERVHQGLETVNAQYPFMLYGTDWLAFAHIVIAVAFIGPLRDPVKNIWVVEFGMIACILVIPLALICGPIRGIPFFWILIDCSFGVFGIIPLIFTHRCIKRIMMIEQAGATNQYGRASDVRDGEPTKRGMNP